MNLFKLLFADRPIPLTPRRAIPMLRGQYAYVCLDQDCQAIMERAPRGVCERCGQPDIEPVQGLTVQVREARRLMEKKPPLGEEAREAIETNFALYLTGR